jgi:ribosomal protein L12E/L44/L45/RPP1/RPP2
MTKKNGNGKANGGSAAVQEAQQILQMPNYEPGTYDTIDILQERIADLELALEDVGWKQLSGIDGSQDFSVAGLNKIRALSRIFYLKNPLINRSVNIQAVYVFAQGMNVTAESDPIKKIIQQFMDDPANKRELTSHQARTMKEIDLQVEADIFFVLFTQAATGRTRVRTLPVSEITEVVKDPDDCKTPWYYKREWYKREFDEATGKTKESKQVAYYPDWKYDPPAAQRKKSIAGKPVIWDSPINHVRVGGLSDMTFGVPETYAGIDWARSYKDFLEDWASIVRALSKFAWKQKAAGGKKGVARAKAKVDSASTGVTESGATTMPAAGVWIQGDGTDLTPMPKTGATIQADDGRRLLLMVAAAMGLPETFYGDVSVGTLATAKTMDRPTELKFRDRQQLWSDIHQEILQYVIDKNALAPKGLVKGRRNADGDVILVNDPGTGEPYDRTVTVSFPPILMHEAKDAVQAVVTAITQNGQLSVNFDERTRMELLLKALGEDDVDEMLDKILAAPREEPPAPRPPTPPEVPPTTEPQQQSMPPTLIRALEAIRANKNRKVTDEEVEAAKEWWSKASRSDRRKALLDAKMPMEVTGVEGG